MDIEEFLLEMADSDECRRINYKRLAIRKYIGVYYAQKPVSGEIDSFMIPFRDYVRHKIEEHGIDIDVLAKYMISTDESNCALFAFTTRFKPKNSITSYQYYDAIARYQIISPFVCSVDMDAFALIVVSYVFDNLTSRKIDISEIVKDEVFSYEVNQYGLSNINGASFRKDGLIYDGKGYYYNVYTNKSLLSAMDSMPAFARIITDAEGDFDILYRLDERLSMPESEYRDYTGFQFEKFYGPQFKFDGSTLKDPKTIIVHINPKNMAKLLMVIKKDFDQIISEPFGILNRNTSVSKKVVMRVRIRPHSYMECITQKKTYLHILILLRINMAMIYINQNIKIVRMVYQLIPIRKAEVNTTKFGVSKTAHFQSKCGIC